jgi:hypothetical protein
MNTINQAIQVLEDAVLQGADELTGTQDWAIPKDQLSEHLELEQSLLEPILVRLLEKGHLFPRRGCFLISPAGRTYLKGQDYGS